VLPALTLTLALALLLVLVLALLLALMIPEAAFLGASARVFRPVFGFDLFTDTAPTGDKGDSGDNGDEGDTTAFLLWCEELGAG
jgi:hypothetical protein